MIACLRLAPGLLGAVVLAGCISVSTEPRALLEHDDGSIVVQRLSCSREAIAAISASRRRGVDALDPHAIRILTWNIHKQWDAGWDDDLRAFTAGNDIVLLQETVLGARLRELIGAAGLRWVMASSFLQAHLDIGVLTAARVPALASCTQRVIEPLLRLPKSAVISWFALAGGTQTLAVVNVHAVNFSLSLGAYREQFDAIGEALARHEGPLILAGDLNTWTSERAAVVGDVARRLNLREVTFPVDRRSAFLGHQLDHIFIRDLDVLSASVTPVNSSDHNPVAATLRVAR